MYSKYHKYIILKSKLYKGMKKEFMGVTSSINIKKNGNAFKVKRKNIHYITSFLFLNTPFCAEPSLSLNVCLYLSTYLFTYLSIHTYISTYLRTYIYTFIVHAFPLAFTTRESINSVRNDKSGGIMRYIRTLITQRDERSLDKEVVSEN